MKFLKYITIFLLLQVSCGMDGVILERWGNGHPKIKQYSIDRSHQLEIHYHENGKIKEKGEVQGGERVGDWKGWHENGELKYEVFYREGKPFGNYFKLHDTGAVKEYGTYDFDGINESEFASYDEDGIIEKRGSFKYGVQVGEWEHYDSEMGTGEKSYFPNGCIKEIKSLLDVELDSLLYTSYHRCDVLKSEGMYVGPYKEGFWTIYWEFGGKKSEGTYHKNKKIGIWTYWYSNNELEKVSFYDGNDNEEIIELGSPRGWVEINDSIDHFIEHRDSIILTRIFKHDNLIRIKKEKVDE